MIKLIEEKNGIKCFELKNGNGASAQIINYGARIHKLFMPDVNGNFVDVVIGFDDIEGYKTDNPYFNAVIGRVANRIGGAKFTLGGKEYVLYKNDGNNHLHGGREGFDRKIWDTTVTKNGLELTYISKDGEEGYPANLSVKVIYSLTDDNALSIEYFAVADGDTLCNLTNHAYFNLSGSFDNDVLKHVLRINGDAVTAVDSELIPNGEICRVKNTPFDFGSFKEIGEEIHENNVFLNDAGGYDINYMLKNDKNTYAAKVFEPHTCIEMEVYTDQPCLQFYSGNFLDGIKGKTVFNKHSAFCLETQGYPNACNIESFPSVVLKKGDTYHSKTVYKFSVFE